MGSFRGDEPAPPRTPALASARLPQGRAQGQRGEAPHSLRTAWSPTALGHQCLWVSDLESRTDPHDVVMTLPVPRPVKARLLVTPSNMQLLSPRTGMMGSPSNVTGQRASVLAGPPTPPEWTRLSVCPAGELTGLPLPQM